MAGVANIVIRALATVTLLRFWESKDGRKAYAKIERFLYADYRLAPCWQPLTQTQADKLE